MLLVRFWTIIEKYVFNLLYQRLFLCIFLCFTSYCLNILLMTKPGKIYFTFGGKNYYMTKKQEDGKTIMCI